MKSEHLRDELRGIYQKLNHKDLTLILILRGQNTSGSTNDLCTRLLEHELTLFKPTSQLDWTQHEGLKSTGTEGPWARKKSMKVALPPELWTLIVRFTNDWELAAALGISDKAIERPASWECPSKIDLAILYNDLPLLKSLLGTNANTKAAAPKVKQHIPEHVLHTVIRFEYVKILEFLYTTYPYLFSDDQIPPLGSRYNSPRVLQWWKDSMPPSHQIYGEQCMDMASSMGQIEVLEWWSHSGLPLKFGRVLDFASMHGHVLVLEWWRTSGLKYKYSKAAMRHASTNGHIQVLHWWLHSGLQLFYDAECLITATRFNQVAVLDWWARCGLVIEYRIMDIEEALGEAQVGGDECRDWWLRKGVDFSVGTSEWMKDRVLNEGAHYFEMRGAD